MTQPHFEITFVPKETKVVSRLYRKLNNTQDFERELKEILSASKIVAEKIEFARTKAKTSKNSLFEDFNSCHAFNGSIKGIKKGFWGGKKWKAEFSLELLYGDNRDAIMFRTDQGGKEMQNIGERLYARIIESIAKYNDVVPWSEITRTGTMNKGQTASAKGFRVQPNFTGTWAPALRTRDL